MATSTCLPVPRRTGSRNNPDAASLGQKYRTTGRCTVRPALHTDRVRAGFRTLPAGLAAAAVGICRRGGGICFIHSSVLYVHGSAVVIVRYAILLRFGAHAACPSAPASVTKIRCRKQGQRYDEADGFLLLPSICSYPGSGFVT